MPTHTIGLSFKTDAGSVPISTTAYTVDSEINQALLVPAGATRQVNVEFAHATINDYCITLLTAGGKTEAVAGLVTLNFNTPSLGTPSLALNAKQPFWFVPAPIVAPLNVFTEDVTTLYLTNPGLVDLVVAIHIGQNLTV